MKYANVQINWNTTFQVPVSELSKFLEALDKYPLVKTEYDSEAGEYYEFIAPEKIEGVQLTSKPAEKFKRVTKQAETV